MWLIRSSMNRHLGCFHLWAVVNNMAINTGVQIPAFNSLGVSIPRLGIARSDGNSVFSSLSLGVFCIYYLESKRHGEVPWAILRCSCRTAPWSVPKLVQRPTRQLHKSRGMLLSGLGSLLPVSPSQLQVTDCQHRESDPKDISMQTRTGNTMA